MKEKLHKTSRWISRFLLYGCLLQLAMVDVLLATDIYAQDGKSVFDIPVVLSKDHYSLQEVLRELEGKTEFYFSFDDAKVPLKNQLTLTRQEGSLGTILIELSKLENIKFKRIGRSIHISRKAEEENSLTEIAARSKPMINVTGQVTAKENGTGLPGVNVLVKGTSLGTVTDVEGQYSINVPNEEDTLSFSSIGYVTLELAVNGRTTLDVQLEEDVQSLDEIVVVGYGTQKKTSITSSISEIDAEDLATKPMTNTRQMIQGVAPGVSVVDAGGSPGQNNVQIKIRGNTTIGSTEPLILVDGIQQNFSDLNPDNIQSVSVLKDASATAIYGSRAANGVLLVTTKEPTADKLSVTYNGSYGLETPTIVPEHLGVEAYLRQQNIATVNAGGTAPYTEEEVQNYVQNVNQGNLLEYPLPNAFFDEIYSPGPMQNHRLAFSGGTEKIKSRLSVQLLDQDGIMPTYNFARQEFRFDNAYTMTDWLRLTTNLTYRRKNIQQPYNPNNVIFTIWHGSQWGVPQYPNGTFGMNSRNINPLLEATLRGSNNSVADYFVANFKAEVDLTKNLTYTLQYGGYNNLVQTKIFENKFSVYDYDTETGVLTDNLLYNNPINSLQERRDHDQQWTLRNLLTYNLSLNKHQINVLLGYEQLQTDADTVSAFRQEFYNNDLEVIGAGSLNNLSNYGGAVEERLRSGFGRINYSYDDRYILEANARYDGSSKFYGASNQFGFFPSFSAAWRIAGENFWAPLSTVVSDLKVRGSWGKTGNNTVALYTFFPGLNISSNYTFGGNLVSTAAATRLVNPGLTWEETTQTNVGLDAELWEGLFNVSLDVWSKKTEGILLALPIPATVGFSGPPQNAGRVDNNGWELAIGHRKIVNNDLTYSIRANLSDFRNEVVDLAGTGPYIGTNGESSVIKVGEPLSAIWGYRSLGLFQTQEDIDNYPTYSSKDNTFPGDMKYEDLNQDGNITPDDKTVIGVQDPHYSFGITTDIRYKNFDFSFFIQGVGQQDRIPFGASIEAGNWLGYTLAIAGDYYTPENTDAYIPRPQKTSRKNNTPEVLSTRFLVDASYVRLKNIQLGYTLPSRIPEKIGMQYLRFYLSGSNVFEFSKSKDWGLDPEFQSGRLGYYYQTSQYVVGVNVRF